MRLFICVLLIVIVFLIYVYAENRMLTVRRYKIKTDNSGNQEPIKIVQISDIHKKKYSNGWSKLVMRVKEISPDMIFITGDLVSRTEISLMSTEALLVKLCRICPVYCSKGNHELDLSGEMMEKYRKMMKKAGAVLLENGNSVFQKNGRKINIYGADLKKSVYKNENGGYAALDRITSEELAESLGNAKDGFNILLAHNPFFFEEYAKWGADLTFSGHVHGGAVNVPFVGGLLSPERRFFPKYTKGLYKKDGKYMLVSTGIGKLRVFNPPEILYAELFLS